MKDICCLDIYSLIPQRLKELTCTTLGVLVLLITCSCFRSALAQHMPNQGEQSSGLTAGQYTVTCSSSGRPVIWVADYGLNDVGMTAMPVRTGSTVTETALVTDFPPAFVIVHCKS